MKIVARVQDAALQEAVTEAAEELEAEVILIGGSEGTNGGQLTDALRTHPDLLIVEATLLSSLADLRVESRARGVALVVACQDAAQAIEAAGLQVEEWLLLPTSTPEMLGRIRAAGTRASSSGSPRSAEYLRYEELLYDRFTGFPTLPVMMERGREMLERTGRITILYIEFVRYSKLEEIYGWQKLDEVLQTTANAVREFYDRQRSGEENLLMVSHA
ncbi:MAG: hypothetical protein WD031_02795, partial [Gemmatimonadota bacterium]